MQESNTAFRACEFSATCKSFRDRVVAETQLKVNSQRQIVPHYHISPDQLVTHVELEKLVRLARYARLYQKRGPKILIERYYPLLCSKQYRIGVLS